MIIGQAFFLFAFEVVNIYLISVEAIGINFSELEVSLERIVIAQVVGGVLVEVDT